MAALNLLSDLKDHCGWTVEHQAAVACKDRFLTSGTIAVSHPVKGHDLLKYARPDCMSSCNRILRCSLAVQVTTCWPPAEADWPFLLPDEDPDFVSDFE